MQLSLGLDIGSTTVKAVVLDGARTVFSRYRRHNADARGALRTLLTEIEERFPDAAMACAVTGSAGLGVADLMRIAFVQEVIAGTEAVERFVPDADVVIELGGEDAKITYLRPAVEQRMNGTCAGGTGAFIDQMATLLHTDAAGLDELAGGADHLYPIASRCGVFAKSDLQPLLNQGAAHTDLAASVFQAVATQTIAGLAQGHPIRGTVVLLGGPLHFLPNLRVAYERSLAEQVDAFVTPDDAHLYVALGAALLAPDDASRATPGVLRARLTDTVMLPLVSPRLRPLFADDDERDAFAARHAGSADDRIDLADADGPLFLGIDAGSTTIKAVLLDDAGRIAYAHYQPSNDPVAAARGILAAVHRDLPLSAYLARACVTGYGEGLVRAALRLDDGEVETMAHFRAADRLCPGVTAVIDIGGQDMKYLRIVRGAVDSIAVNEACSSGCGSFLQTFAAGMGIEVADFARLALESSAPVDLGTRCTVFMNSSVKQAQREGATPADIAAGLCCSVVRNALFKVIKLRDTGQLGDRVVVQGGTFLNDAVLRAFELQTGVEVVRPRLAGHMGALGAALTAQRNWTGGRSTALSPAELDAFTVETRLDTCRLCQNHCQLTISSFGDGTRHVSGNRCERGASVERLPKKSELPDLVDYKYRRLFGYRRLTKERATRGEIGIPRVLGMYENFPLWFTILTELRFRVTVSGRSSHEVFERGMESIPAENACYPAKLAHGHIESLLDRGVTTIFYPCIPHEATEFAGSDGNFNCPIVAFYPQVLQRNMARLTDPGVTYLAPMLNLDNRDKLASRLVEVFADWGVTLEEARQAVAAGFAEDAAVRADIRAEGARALEYLRERGLRGIVLAGRPYHVDPEINHGIPSLINGLGMGVLTEDALIDPEAPRLARPLRVRDQWTYHSRLYEAAAVVGEAPELSFVQLNSFGCGVDAITTDQVAEILEAAGDLHTVLKIDEVSNLGAATIRLRSLQAATAEREGSRTVDTTGEPARAVFGHAERETHTIYAPQMAPMHFRLLMPVLRKLGYRVELLEHASAEDIEVGLRYVNNDACFPAIMVIGQLVNKIRSGEADPDRSTVGITQTGGMCRATNYAALLRKALREAGYPQVPVLAISLQGLEDNPGFTLTPGLLHPAIQALVVGDLLQNLVLRTRPYEAEPGAADALYRRWDTAAQEFLQFSGDVPSLGRHLGFGGLVDRIVADFDALVLRPEPRRPRVGIVGEILVKFHPDANNNVIDVIESEGCEAVLPGMLPFFLMGLYSARFRADALGIGDRSVALKRLAVWVVEQYQRPVARALARCNGKFDTPPKMKDLAAKADDIISLGTLAGEGWLLTAEMVELIEAGAPNIVCAQPFACLPNHVVGKGMFAELRRRHPEANVVAVDYDPGASETNQLNRIKLMIATAFKRQASGDRATADV